MLLSLFFTFLNIGAFAFGGGYAILHLLEESLTGYGVTSAEFLDILSISQMTPGPIGIKAATFAGIKVAGFPGALAATLGVIAVSIVVMLILSYFFYKYQGLKPVGRVLWAVRPIAVAMIIAAGYSLCKETFFAGGVSSIDIPLLIIFALSLAALQLPGKGALKKLHRTSPMIIMLASAAIGLILAAV